MDRIKLPLTDRELVKFRETIAVEGKDLHSIVGSASKGDDYNYVIVTIDEITAPFLMTLYKVAIKRAFMDEINEQLDEKQK